MKCEEAQNIILTDYLDNCLAEEAKIALDDHLGGCADCRQFCATARESLVDPFHDLPRERLPRSVVNAVLDQLHEKEPVVVSVSLAESLDRIWQWCFPSLAVAKVSATLFICFLIAGTVLGVSRVQQAKQKERVFYLAQVAAIPASDQKNMADYGTAMESYFLGERGDS